MPSPLGHALTGFAVGWLAAPDSCRPLPLRRAATDRQPSGPHPSARPFNAVRRWRWPLAFAAAGMAADLDLLVGLHSRYTHSIGAAFLVYAVAWLVLRTKHPSPIAVAGALALSYASHLLLDFLASDATPPLGIMALWPVSSGFYLSPVTVFMGISRKYWLGAAWTQNAVSVAWELLILLPLAALAAWLRPGRTG